MTKITMQGDNYLVQKEEKVQASEFVNPGETRGAIYVVKHAPEIPPKDGKTDYYAVDSAIVLKPGDYDNIEIDGDVYVPITPGDVLAVVESEKK